jgi:hypothetical protein
MQNKITGNALPDFGVRNSSDDTRPELFFDIIVIRFYSPLKLQFNKAEFTPPADAGGKGLTENPF